MDVYELEFDPPQPFKDVLAETGYQMPDKPQHGFRIDPIVFTVEQQAIIDQQRAIIENLLKPMRVDLEALRIKILEPINGATEFASVVIAASSEQIQQLQDFKTQGRYPSLKSIERCKSAEELLGDLERQDIAE